MGEKIPAVVRRMEERDLEQTAEIEKLCFSEAWSYTLLEAGIYSPYDVYYVLDMDGRILGYADLRLLAGEGEIQRIAVLPEYRRMGAGKKLMDAMAAYARENKAYAVSLEVRESNFAARNLYEAYGFRMEAVRRGYYHNPIEDAVIMWLREV